MSNPVESTETFFITLCNPNPTSSKTKDGPKYRVSFEMLQDEWQNFMDAETNGMVIECACQVTGRNTGPLPRDKDTVDAFTGETDAEAEEKTKGGPLSVRSDALARDPDFLSFVLQSAPALFIESNQALKEASPHDFCRHYIRYYCHVDSRKKLDHFASAADDFKRLLSEFTRWVADDIA